MIYLSICLVDSKCCLNLPTKERYAGITNELLGDIREGKKIDPFLRTQLEAIELGRDSSFNVGSDGVLRLQDSICVPNVPELRKMILKEGRAT